MDLLLEKKKPNKYDNELKKIINKLRLFNNKIEIRGTYNLNNLIYYSDIDLYSLIKIKQNNKIYNNLINIINFILSNKKIYLTEIKIQLKNGDKFKYFNNDDFINKSDFNKIINNLDIIKLDFVIIDNNKEFLEISIIYDFNTGNKIDYIKKLEDDYNEFKKQKLYFKAIKRKFSIYKINKDYDNIKKYMKLFNSDVGKMNQLKNRLETVKLIRDNYKDNQTNKIIDNNLKKLLNTNTIEKNNIDNIINKKINELNKVINNKVKKYL